MIIIHIAYITRLVTNDAWHAYVVIGFDKIYHRAGVISYFAEQANTVVGCCGYGRGRGSYHLMDLAIMRLATTVMHEVGAHNQVVGACTSGQEAKTTGQEIYCID